MSEEYRNNAGTPQQRGERAGNPRRIGTSELKQGPIAIPVEHFRSLEPGDVAPDDFVFIKTAGGQRYRLRGSRSRAAWVIADEASGFKNERVFHNAAKGVFARIGESLRFRLDGDGADRSEQLISHPVTSIEVRKGMRTALDTAMKTAQKDDALSVVRRMLDDQIRGR